MVTPLLVDNLSATGDVGAHQQYTLRPDRCIIEVSGRIGPVAAVRLRYRAISGTWTSAIQADASGGPAFLQLEARPALTTPHIVGRYVPVRRSMAQSLHVAVTAAPGGTSGPATVLVSDGAAIAWTFASRLRVLSHIDDVVLVDLHGMLENASGTRPPLAVWLRAAAEFTR